MHFPLSIYDHGRNVTITNTSKLQVKSEDADYYTISTDVSSFALVLENKSYSNGLMFSNHYTEDGTLLATYTYYNEQLISIDLSDAIDDPIETVTKMSYQETRGFFKDLTNCIRAKYIEHRDAFEEAHPIICDLTLFCSALAVYGAILDCSL